MGFVPSPIAPPNANDRKVYWYDKKSRRLAALASVVKALTGDGPIKGYSKRDQAIEAAIDEIYEILAGDG